jgi:hypothetical protein
MVHAAVHRSVIHAHMPPLSFPNVGHRNVKTSSLQLTSVSPRLRGPARRFSRLTAVRTNAPTSSAVGARLGLAAASLRFFAGFAEALAPPPPPPLSFDERAWASLQAALCPPFQWAFWQSGPQYCTVRHVLQLKRPSWPQPFAQGPFGIVMQGSAIFATVHFFKKKFATFLISGVTECSVGSAWMRVTGGTSSNQAYLLRGSLVVPDMCKFLTVRAWSPLSGLNGTHAALSARDGKSYRTATMKRKGKIVYFIENDTVPTKHTDYLIPTRRATSCEDAAPFLSMKVHKAQQCLHSVKPSHQSTGRGELTNRKSSVRARHMCVRVHVRLCVRAMPYVRATESHSPLPPNRTGR